MEDPALPTRLEPGGTNAIGRTLGLLGDEWTLLILLGSIRGRTRYGQFLSTMSISNAVLTARLVRLTEAGLLDRRVVDSNHKRISYHPTERTLSLWPLLVAIWDWERTWVDTHTTELPAIAHTKCGHDVSPVLCCAACREPVAARDVHAEWGPSGSWKRSAPDAVTRKRYELSTNDVGAQQFPETMTLFGNRWASAMIGAIQRGLTRFSELESATGAPPTVVADRLRAFCEIGVVESTTGSGRTAYHLTDKGRAYFPVVAVSLQWAERWFHAPEGPALLSIHRGCGAPFVARFACGHCGARLTGRDLDILTPPSSPVRRQGES
jgi:DNA-binding HxlR family transcriptional regulator